MERVEDAQGWSRGYIYLAGAVLDDEVAALADGAGLLRVGLGRAGIGLGLELVVFGVRHLPTASDQDRNGIRSRFLQNRSGNTGTTS
jgi:hypothetical protein